MASEKTGWKSHCIHPEIIQTSFLGRLQKKSLEHKDCLYVASVWYWTVRKPQMDNRTTLTQFLEFNFANLGHVFIHWVNWASYLFIATRNTTFFSSTVCVISRLVSFLIRRQSSEGVLWRSYFRETPRKTVKQLIFTIVVSLQLCWKFAVLQIFF